MRLPLGVTITELTALLELFADVDTVFSEPDALRHPASLGRIYRSWKTTRATLDPDYKAGN